jgi:CHAP domain
LRTAKKPPDPVPIVRKASTLGGQALAASVKELGTKESPANSNKTKYGKWFGVDGVPWCNIFVSYCFVNGAEYVICAGYKGAGVYANGCTYVPTTEGWLRATGMWKGRTEPMPGDIAIYNWQGGAPDHIGIVEEYLGGGRFNAIEGNTAVGNDANGGEVMRRLRYLTDVDGFGRVVK